MNSILEDYATTSAMNQALASKINNPSGWTTGQVLTKTQNWEAWQDAQWWLPEWWNEWQFIRKTASWSEWVDWELVEFVNKYDYSAMRWPCAEWFHIPTVDNWNNLKAIYNAIVPSWNRDLTQHLKFVASKEDISSSSSASIPYPTKIIIGIRDWSFHCWLCEQKTIKSAYTWWSSMSSLQDAGSSSKSGLKQIRPFKDIEVIPDSTWTALYQWEWNAWIYHNSSLWLISLSSDWYTRLTISDKNLWATNIWDNWNMYQWGNNYGFTFPSWEYSSWFWTDFVDAGSYWPLNYYSNSLPVFRSDSGADVFYYWDSSNNSNLRWWETWVITTTEKYAWGSKINEVPTGWTEWQILMIVSWTPTWVTPTAKWFKMLSPNSPLSVPYDWYGTESQYSSATKSNDTEYRSI